jgi:carbamoyltransferase
MGEALYILGIHDGHNCGATLSRGGEIVASVSEERLTRNKNEVGYPKRSIDDVLRIAGVSAGDLDRVAYASLFMHGRQYLTDLQPWYRVGLEHQRSESTRPRAYEKVIFEQRRQERVDAVVEHLGIGTEKVDFLEHHQCHLAAAYYTAPNVKPGQQVLGLTCDGAGDNLSGTVSICQDNTLERIKEISRHASLGKIYSRITMLLGMTPWEHEYKVMGLAPYASPERSNDAAEGLRKLLKLSADGLGFDQAGDLSMNYCYEYLREAFENVRFDSVSGAAQLFTEEMLTAWVQSCIRKTGISDIVCGGGVFMNIKANMLIANLPEVTSMYVMPSGGDESLSIGACLHTYYQQTGDKDHGASVLGNLYLGGDFDRKAEEQALQEFRGDDAIQIREPEDIDLEAADMIAEGKIVARCRGRMEWGARSLGNRSILASADNYGVVDKINQAIKQRDFWMPFAPSIREESAGRYLDDPKNIQPWFMTHGFAVKHDGRADLSAGCHPRDHTIRPQIVTKQANPGYHKLLSRFEETTGRGGLLNTSFNLHGFPIVYSPGDAIDVLMRSGLEHLALNNFIISKRNA